MILSHQKIWKINIIISAIVLALCILFPLEIMTSLGQFFVAINRPMTYSLSYVDAIIISMIPIWAYPLYSYQPNISLGKMTTANLKITFSIIMTCVIAFIVIAKFNKSDNPLLPDCVVIAPFEYFWTLILLIGVIVPHLLKKLFHRRRKNNSPLDIPEETEPKL